MSSTTSIPDLVLEGVGHTYGWGLSRPVVALDRTDLTIDGGSVIALLGPSGSGKSTLLEILAGHRLPTEGQVLLGGNPVVGPGRRGVVIGPSWLPVQTQIAQVLATDPDVLLIDEPFEVGGDPEREHLQHYLHSIWAETGKTIILASRDAAHVVPLATRVIALSPGPGTIVRDVHVDFAQRFESSGALLADPDVARFTAQLRVA